MKASVVTRICWGRRNIQKPIHKLRTTTLVTEKNTKRRRTENTINVQTEATRPRVSTQPQRKVLAVLETNQFVTTDYLVFNRAVALWSAACTVRNAW